MSIADLSETRPMRADARRNRERVLAAARRSFAEYGHAGSMEDVARRAGVGVGTVYRHFPDKSALLDALLAERFAEFAELGRAALELADPWTSFSDWLIACGASQASDMGFCDALGDGISDARRAELAESTGLSEVNARILKRGQQAGVIRPDAEASDIPMLMAGVAATARRGPTAIGGSWRRHLAIAVDGMRAPGTGALPR